MFYIKPFFIKEDFVVDLSIVIILIILAYQHRIKARLDFSINLFYSNKLNIHTKSPLPLFDRV